MKNEKKRRKKEEKRINKNAKLKTRKGGLGKNKAR